MAREIELRARLASEYSNRLVGSRPVRFWKPGRSTSGEFSNRLLETDLWQALAQRELLGVAQLFITGYQPLAFVTGQLLHLATPIATLLGIHFLSDWAERLSQADVLRDS